MYSPTGTPLAAVTEVPWSREAARNLHPQAIRISTEQQEPKAAVEPLFEYLPQRQKRDLRLPSASRNMLSIIQANEGKACAESWAKAGLSPAMQVLGLHHPEHFPPMEHLQVILGDDDNS